MDAKRPPIIMPYGEGIQEAEIGWGRVLGTLDVLDVPAEAEPETALKRALANPIGLDTPLAGLVRPKAPVAIVVSDAFRNTGIDRLLPALLAVLNEAGAQDEDIAFLFATGTHRAPNEAEQMRILGKTVFERFRGRAHAHDAQDADQLVSRGTTSNGTPVYINRRAAEAGLLIATGAVVFHYFGGFGGGRKSIVPGIAGIETIARNHARNLDPHEDQLNPNVRIGALDGNPVAEDMLEAAKRCRVDFIVNTVLNRQGEIAAVFAGELDAAHRAAADFARRLFAVSIPEQADLVVASAGTAKNFVQSHKALFNAYQAAKPQRPIILLTEAPEGLGGNRFAEWLALGDRGRVIAELRKNAEINGQTALSTLDKAKHTIMVTGLSEADVALTGARRAANLADALAMAKANLDTAGVPNPALYLMPSASYTVPFLEA